MAFVVIGLLVIGGLLGISYVAYLFIMEVFKTWNK